MRGHSLRSRSYGLGGVDGPERHHRLFRCVAGCGGQARRARTHLERPLHVQQSNQLDRHAVVCNISGAGHTSTVEDIVRDMKSLEQFDTPQAFTIGYRYEFPWARGARGILSWFPGGWKLSGTTTFKSGTPAHEMAFDTFGKIINTANRGR